MNFIARGKRVLEIEKNAIEQLAQYINDDFSNACQLMYDCKGRVIVIGMGKSGHIGNKIAATLASTGTPAFFVHPGEASHGDLGMITQDDVLLMISNSGETAEVINLIPVIKRIGAKIVGMSGKQHSTLAQQSNVHICIAISEEACPLGLAPTASTTATLAMGDAIAVALLEEKGFTADDFALSHPGGSLGKRLLLMLKDIMHQGEALPVVAENTTVKNALLEMTAKGLGMTAVVDNNGLLSGIFTDGDLRRILEQRIDIHATAISEVMTKQCTTANESMLAAEALNIMEQKKINGLLVVDQQQQPIGALNMQDLLKAGVL
ncbi:MAG: KpsF/GutQ family sugar-phosphate isomerase [Pseudoalteromonas spongiae]|uniref:Arabinose 5-phosphate isomerase n=1 Tax=Pseudoalteromonas spongiae TaxID=298657 RepID=A0ABU8EUD3_9GAMM|nr:MULTISPECIES: KpsF/GutQ family sugar-phosphate isomerase [Pseudoalteromonas]MCF6456470.1 KpsF/GutQ family sugar-phosphate isomerase [Pseudoalteromonas sp. MMG024]MEC8327967.1 KpsF/GutQ family sugar-phosphate isomerase [Pseudomonadota bacterium]TMO86620.1 D-arabinose 5-phosphate isomerase [Pseudoalteromonas spongiae]